MAKTTKRWKPPITQTRKAAVKKSIWSIAKVEVEREFLSERYDRWRVKLCNVPIRPYPITGPESSQLQADIREGLCRILEKTFG